MISLTAEYALRAVVWMAGRPGEAVGTPKIARATKVPLGYLSKVLQALSRSKLVSSKPGRTGGFMLRRPATEMSVLDVVQAVDPILRIRSCPLGKTAHHRELCPLHRRLDQVMAALEQAFAESTIAELAGDNFGRDCRAGGHGQEPDPGLPRNC